MLLIPPQLSGPSPEPHYLRIYRYFKENILCGSIPTNCKLPSIRALAQHLGISRNPVETAYGHLVAEGYIVNRAKSGYCAAKIERLDMVDAKPSILKPSHDPATHIDIDFSHDAMDMEHFPLALWKKMTLQILRTTDRGLFGYGDHKGELRLRALISEHLRSNRGVVCDPQQVIITSGTQQSLLIISSLHGHESGAKLGVEAAMHPGIHRIFSQQRLNPVPIPLEADGICCDDFTRYGSLSGIYVTPSHQFPYGMILPASKRVRLLQWATQTKSIVIEDDYDSEFLHEGRPLPALQGLDQAGCVVYLGTFSKVLAPAMRLSYLVLPPSLLNRFEHEYANYDQTASRLTQKTMELFMERGHLERHIRRMRKVYREKRETFLASVEACFREQAEILGSSSGLHLILEINSAHSTDELVQRAEAQGVKIYPVANYHVDGSDVALNRSAASSRFVLGYGGLTPEQIKAGIKRLAAAWLN